MKENSLFRKCLEILNRDDVKNDLKLLVNPITEYVMFEMRPYAYMILLILLTIMIVSIVNLLLLIYYFKRGTINNIS